jgi:hypothetical protein
MIVELHFQDGFNGEGIEVLVDGGVRAAFTAKTRYQINLAHVAEVDLKPGQKLAIRIENAGDLVELPLPIRLTHTHTTCSASGRAAGNGRRLRIEESIRLISDCAEVRTWV